LIESSDLALLLVLIFLILVSAFFSSAETGMMTINRYRLKHHVRSKNAAAIRVSELLSKQDKLIGLILIGNNFVNILASSIATILAVRLWGDLGVAIATVSLTFVVLIFAEVTPKTLASIYPEKVAYPASFILKPLMYILYPLVWLVNFIAIMLIRPFGLRASNRTDELNADELRSVVKESSSLIPPSHQRMLLSVLNLESITVQDIMIPKSEIAGIDLEDDWDLVMNCLKHMQHTRMLVYRDEVDNVIGMLHARDLANLMSGGDFTKEKLINSLREVTYIPEGTPLTTQLIKFKARRNRISLVVDEYGDILGLVTLEDILEEIVGEFTTDITQTIQPDIHKESEQGYLIDGSITLRELNKALKLDFPLTGAKTLSGLVVDYLEMIPEPLTCVRISGYPMEIVQVKDNKIKTLRLYPKLRLY